MALGVLNNLSAIYAENNLNNTSNSLQTVLQQLSSGSRINSGADDSAGLSLVNGLEANQTALTQSKTNATEGVGLLQVADGALSQVTSLLDRAITLATEASNGTLNTTQEGAANQEYQSILSEINNIGQTTTYNQQQVFTGAETAIYTGDSSAAGSSIDDLNIRTLSESSMGDTGGKMAYSDGANNVFINLSSTNAISGEITNAQDTDTLNASGTTTINVNYLVKGANGSESTATTSITVGAGSYDAATGTTYANTANGLIAAINGSGLGLTATFATQGQAGITGGGTQTGIEITGGLLSAGVDPGTASTSATLDANGIPAGELLTEGQTVTVAVGGSTAAAITINSTTSTLAELANAINHPVSPSIQNALVTATVITNGDGSQSLSLADGANTGGALTVSFGGNAYSGNLLTDGTTSAAPVTLSFTNSSNNYTAGQSGSQASATLGISGNNDSSDTLAGNIVLSNNPVAGADAFTFVMASGANIGQTINVGNYGNGAFNLDNLASAIQANLGVSTSVSSSGITMTSKNTGTVLELVPGAGNNTLTDAASMAVSNVEGWTPSTLGNDATATLAMNGDNGFAANGSTLLSGNLVLNNTDLGNEGPPITFSMGGANVGAANTVYVNAGGGSASVTQLMTAIGLSSLDVTGSVATGSIVLTSGDAGTSFTVNSSGLVYSPALTATPTANHAGALSTGAQFSTGGASVNSDTLAGNVVLSNNGNTVTFSMGVAGNGTSTIGVSNAGGGLGNLVAAINGDQAALGLTASLNVSNGTVALTQNTAGADVVVAGTGLTDNYATQFTTPASGSNSFGAQYMGGILTLHDGGNINNLGGNLTGTFTLENNDLGGKGDITDTFVMGGGSEVLAGDGGTVTVLGNSLNSLIQAVNDETNNAGSNLDITASLDTASGGLFLQSGSLTTTAVTVQSSGANHTLTDNVTETPTGGTGGSANAAGQVVFGNAGTNLFTDPVMGTITLTNSNSGNPEKATFTMDGSTGHTTLGDLQTLIDNAGIGLTASIGGTGLTVAVSGANYGNSLSETGSLADAFGVNLGASTTGQPAAAAQNASATVNTTAGNTIGTSDTIAGNLVVQNGAVKHTFIMGTGAGDIGGTTIGALAQAISNNVALGVTADVNPATHALELQANNPGTVLTATSNLNDTVPEAVTGSQNIGTLNTPSTTTLTLGSGTISSSDTITGTIALSANGNNVTFTMGATAAQALNSTASNVYINGTTLTDLESAIDSSTGQYGLNISATPNGSSLVLSSMVDNTTTIGVISNSLYDDFSNLASQASLGTFANVKDQVSGTISYSLGVTTPVAKSIPIAAGSSVQDMVNTINGATNNHPYGVTASLIPSGNGTFETVMLTSDTYGSDGQIEDTTGTSFVDSTTTATLSYKAGNAYDTGLSGGTISSGTAIYDSSSGQSNSLAGEAEIVSNSNGSSGVATISYSDGAGEALNSTDLTSQTDAETALNDLNVAISDVAAQDGYIGAQINTLNSISQVMSTQQENVVSAQNAIQATDYASATSNMSKYEILSQTGIAALAQANSVEQEVTKLLQ